MRHENLALHTIVHVELTPFGESIYRNYMNAEFERATGQEKPTEDERRPPLRVGRELDLPLWELLKIFGPMMVSATRVPFTGSLQFSRPESADEVGAGHAQRRATAAEQTLAELMGAMQLATGYDSPEMVAGKARMYINGNPGAMPNGEGPWWLGSEIVQVRRVDGELVFTPRHGRRKRVAELDGWGGPAIRDPRVRPQTEDGEDIPF